ncbi:Os04g0313200 [Oryza sativa Japonica Group]|nr:Os04g0313200 [Oryza sativa Japonica Group]
MANAHLKIVNDRLKKLREEGLIPASVSLSSTEVPIQREGWLVDVARGIGSIGYNRFGGSSGSGTAGSNGDMA